MAVTTCCFPNVFRHTPPPASEAFVRRSVQQNVSHHSLCPTERVQSEWVLCGFLHATIVWLGCSLPFDRASRQANEVMLADSQKGFSRGVPPNHPPAVHVANVGEPTELPAELRQYFDVIERINSQAAEDADTVLTPSTATKIPQESQRSMAQMTVSSGKVHSAREIPVGGDTEGDRVFGSDNTDCIV
eukprot:GHVU01051245.1.p1 GENE.GHVU01051245.1~~GHVU01051245.1.p1  ORF type:complete len:188 (+),score=7.71 GHVU01051245.1:525-1088(+)